MASLESEPTKEGNQQPSDEEKNEALQCKSRGNDFFVAQNYEKAVEMYTKAIELDGTSAVYFCNRAASLSLLGRHECAVDDCKAAIVLDSNYLKAYFRLGSSLLELKKPTEALFPLKHAIVLCRADEYKDNAVVNKNTLRKLRKLVKAAEKMRKELDEEGSHDYPEPQSPFANDPLRYFHAQQAEEFVEMLKSYVRSGKIKEKLADPSFFAMIQLTVNQNPQVVNALLPLVIESPELCDALEKATSSPGTQPFQFGRGNPMSFASGGDGTYSHPSSSNESGVTSPIVEAVEKFLKTEEAKQIDSAKSKILTDCFREYKGECCDNPTQEQLDTTLKDVSLHLYNFFGRSDKYTHDSVMDAPEFARNLDAIPKFLKWFEKEMSAGGKSFDLTVAKEIADRGVEEFENILKLQGYYPGVINFLKDRVFGAGGVSGQMAFLMQMAQQENVGEMLPPDVNMEDTLFQIEYCRSASRWMEGAGNRDMSLANLDPYDEEGVFMRSTAELFDHWKAELKERKKSGLKLTGRKLSGCRVRILKINKECGFWSGRQFDSQSAPLVNVEFEENVLSLFREGQILTGDYQEMSDGTWILSNMGYTWPSFYEVDRFVAATVACID